MDTTITPNMITDQLNCVCVMHGDKYDWKYVDNLYAMVHKNLSRKINFHVFTESGRQVPDSMIKHELIEWPNVAGPRKSWWYKMQVFDPSRISGQILYLDLDVIIIDELNWICDLNPEYFWAIRDWRYLWRPRWTGINSSVMYWENKRFSKIWAEFQSQKIDDVVNQYRGDQDFISNLLSEKERRFFISDFILSWKWQVKDGGMDFKTKRYKRPGTGSILTNGTKILVFHGDPNPHEVEDPVVQKYWNIS